MSSPAAPAAHKPTFEGDFALPAEFPLAAGGLLRNATLRYALYGEINSARDNVVFVCHALSGSASVAEWWPAIWHSGNLIDPVRDAILGINILGSCYGSTGPSSINLETGRPYGNSFPLVQISDIVRAETLLLDALEIKELKLAIGASIGGMQAIALALHAPSRLHRAIAIAVAPLGAMGLGLNHLQREAIKLDPAWNNGDYEPTAPPHRGLALARALAVSSYKSATLFDQRHGRKPDRNLPGPEQNSAQATTFDISGYLDHQGEKFNARFDANSYLAITRMMDLFDPARNQTTAAETWGRIQAEVTLIGISSDWLFPPEDVRALAQSMRSAGVGCTYREMHSSHGHDAFLAEPEKLLELLT